jgi:hypothetical protein
LGLETVDGAECYHLRGSVPASALAALIGSQESTPSAAAIDLWVGTKDFTLRQARLVGAILPEESPLLERSLKFSDFDKPMTIKAPIP